MTSSRPYLVRAIYDWLLDNNLTPYVMVDAMFPEVSVPQQFVKDGKIILNIAPSAVTSLALGNREIEFSARFSGIPHHIHVPVMAVQAIYSYENGRGMVFNEDEDGGDDIPPDDKPPKKEHPHLRVIK
ncbi:MAG: ClpXP protease specificity-enhancing factor [Coxiella sp. (in: Bacteria)]|nr:MAG: ClpXP protease specificity-enhancing factor [Coxiella sp. (in: g-proteobacteria)]